jgi:phosphopantothenoylcysteine decarboxylase/phosphopantothenate--cysteine ligase
VSDYRPQRPEELKIKRGKCAAQVELVQNPDILREVGRLRTNQVLVGFAAESHDLEAEAGRKLKEKGLDLIVANDVTRPDSGFAVDTNQVTILRRDGKPLRLPLLSKEEVAERVLDLVAQLLQAVEPREGAAGA